MASHEEYWSTTKETTREGLPLYLNVNKTTFKEGGRCYFAIPDYDLPRVKNSMTLVINKKLQDADIPERTRTAFWIESPFNTHGKFELFLDYMPVGLPNIIFISDHGVLVFSSPPGEIEISSFYLSLDKKGEEVVGYEGEELSLADIFCGLTQISQEKHG